MIFSTIKFIFFVLTIIGFGFISLRQFTKIKSVLLLIPFSVSFGISSYIFICHALSFYLGLKNASVITLFLLFFATIVCIVCKFKELFTLEIDITKKNLLLLLTTYLVICSLTFLAMSRYGFFDKDFHINLTSTIFHNNIYPPRDLHRPSYLLLYHFGSDLISGAIYYICNIEVTLAFELLLSILSGITFLSFFSLAWMLTKKFNISYIAGLCTYFGGGLLWLDAILRYFLNQLPTAGKDWTFIQTFLNLGIHGSIINPPSTTSLLPTCALGYSLLIFLIILLWKTLEEKNLIDTLIYLLPLNISSFTLFLSAKWLYVTFWAGVLPFVLFLLFKKQNKSAIFILILLLTSFLLNKSIGNVLFLHDEIQTLGRTNIYNVAFKEMPFFITSWGRFTENILDYEKVFAFSWRFFSEFGLSLILLPIAIVYLLKSKNLFALLLTFCTIFTFPIPLFIDFKTNPADLNRFFAFGNAIIILLISCGIGELFKNFFQLKWALLTYIIGFCFSPICGLIISVIFTPYVYYSNLFVNKLLNKVHTIQSPTEIPIRIIEFNKHMLYLKYKPYIDFKNELKFFNLHSKPGDVAISSFTTLPLYAGIYTIIPANTRSYKDQVHSSFDSIHLTTITTLDPHLLDDLKIKWIMYDSEFKKILPKDTIDILNNKSLFKLMHTSTYGNKKIEIFRVKDPRKLLKSFTQKTAWLLANGHGQPIELAYLFQNKVSLFPSSYEALKYLKYLYKSNLDLKKELITAQAITISDLEKQIKSSNLNFILDKKF